MKIETEVQVRKGEGRDGLCDTLQATLMVGRAVISPGMWRVTLEGPVRPQEIEKAKRGEA